MNPHPIRSLLIANRSEIAIRVMRAASEMRIRTVAIYSQQDRQALHRFKADESYLVGEGQKPLAAYLDGIDILRIARHAGVDAIHPGYGFLSENPEFAESVMAAGLHWIGPSPAVMRTLGNKVAARHAAVAAGVPVMPATPPLPADLAECLRLAEGVGFPVMLKASWGGGGRGMRVIEGAADLPGALEAARREALAAFGNDEVYFEKLIRHARHVEVQILGDQHGNVVHLHERDCTVQRRNQKVVERAPAPYLDAAGRASLCDNALRLMRAVGYTHAGTVEFLMDADDGRFYFIEVNPRIQVEHTVTEMITGVDIVKAQIRITEGGYIGVTEGTDDPRHPTGVPAQADIPLNGHALQCRVTTEDPENGFLPDYGRLAAYRSAAGFGIRLDAGTAYGGAVITPYYDSLLVKVTAWAPTARETIQRMDRALREFRIRGVATNLQFLENLINHPAFATGELTTRFIENTPELLAFAARRDRASKLLRFLGEVAVNGNPEVQGRTLPALPLPKPVLPAVDLASAIPDGSRQRLNALGPAGFAQWMLAQKQVLLTDTTMRDAHQSLLATRIAHGRHAAHRAVLCAPAAAALFAGMLGRRHLRRGAALPEGRPLAAPGAVACPGAQRAVPDAAARLQRGGLHQLCRQRRAPFRAPGGGRRHRPVPRFRLTQTGSRTCAWRSMRWSSPARCAKVPSATPATCSTAADPSTTWPTTWASHASCRRPACTCWASRTWPACAALALRRRW